MTTFTYRDKMRECQREAGYRRFVYPKLVASGKMRQAEADKRIAILEEMALDYGRAAEKQERAEKAQEPELILGGEPWPYGGARPTKAEGA